MALLDKQGYGQLEPNMLIAQRTGEIFAQLPVASFSGVTSNGFAAIEQGMFLNYDYGTQRVVFPSAVGGGALTMLVMNEVRLFGPFLTNKDFALFPSPSNAASSYTNSGIIPGLAQSANQILSSGANSNLAFVIDNAGLGYSSATNIGVTINFVDGTKLAGTASITGTTFGYVNAINVTYLGTSTPSSVSFPAPTGITGTSVTAVARVYSVNSIAAGAGNNSSSPSQAYGSQVVYPRLYKPNVGDIITTNLIANNTSAYYGATTTIDDSAFDIGKTLIPGINGVLIGTGQTGVTSGYLTYKIVTKTTTPDLQPALKLQCVQTGTGLS
jgi:hypothetical protein